MEFKAYFKDNQSVYFTECIRATVVNVPIIIYNISINDIIKRESERQREKLINNFRL